MASRPSAVATAGSISLHNNKNAHPTVRLDNFLRSTDATFQTAEAPQHGDRFVRKMATYGQVRPSVSFTSQSRAVRPFKEVHAMDMSRLPNPMMDPKGDPRELTMEYPLPPPEIDSSFLKMYKNHSLMMPSERYKEHLAMKAGEQKWREDRDATFRYKKRRQVLERHYPNGVIGIDGPTYEGTQLYAQRRAQLQAAGDVHADKAVFRHDSLTTSTKAQEAVSCDNYGEPHDMARSKDIGLQRKCVDPQRHPFRYLDTHERLFPKHIQTWDPERAAMIRSHDVRERQHCPITGKDNSMSYRVAPRWDEDVPQRTVYGNLGGGGHDAAPAQSMSAPYL
eukprot:TRINITY_DN64214_c0_g1_i1.p1 TRINITY_DN64214_c0_g1~~TRINITY_DN64214_c0_g1_i1.p1  ORF type:complete len:336 (-),score=68.44 TRINITY_DN64214_c0_g1_i1:71-1078(-)